MATTATANRVVASEKVVEKAGVWLSNVQSFKKKRHNQDIVHLGIVQGHSSD